MGKRSFAQLHKGEKLIRRMDDPQKNIGKELFSWEIEKKKVVLPTPL